MERGKKKKYFGGKEQKKIFCRSKPQKRKGNSFTEIPQKTGPLHQERAGFLVIYSFA